MNELIEKMKSMDRKTLIGIGVGAVVVIVAIIVLIVALGVSKPASSDDTEKTEAATETVFETVDATETTEATELEEATETTEMMEPEVVSGGGMVNGVEQMQVVVNPETGKEIMGAGSSSEPYMEIMDANTMSVTTVKVPAGTIIYYKIQRVAGLYCTINDADAYVITSNGTRHNASNGQVSFVVEDGLASDYITLKIGNASSSAKSFTLKFSNLTGSYNNPTVISTAELGAVTTTTNAGDDKGHWYRYTAEVSGTMTFVVNSCSASTPAFSVTNTSSMANKSFEADGVVDANGCTYVTIDVSAGDVLLINVAVNAESWSYPAAQIVWSGRY